MPKIFTTLIFITCSTNGLQRRHLLVPDQHSRKRRSIRRWGQFDNVYNHITSPKWFVKSYIYTDVSVTLMAVMKLWFKVVLAKSRQMKWWGGSMSHSMMLKVLKTYVTDLCNSSCSFQKSKPFCPVTALTQISQFTFCSCVYGLSHRKAWLSKKVHTSRNPYKEFLYIRKFQEIISTNITPVLKWEYTASMCVCVCSLRPKQRLMPHFSICYVSLF
jgi:hypothetical protein